VLILIKARNIINSIYGIILCIVIGVVSLLLSASIPISAVTIAIILGIAIRNIIKPGELFEMGIAYSGTQILSFSIILMGVNLNYSILQELGYKSIVVIIVAVTVTLISSVFIARIFKFDKKFALLIGIGNGICGTSAIVATEKIIGVSEKEVGLSITIVNFLGTLGIFLLPFIGAVVFEFTYINSGLLIGNTLQAVGQVVAAGFSVGESAGQTATIVKMARILMLTPAVIILIIVFSRRNMRQTGGRNILKQGIPLFIVGFILFSFIPTFSLLNEEYIQIISDGSTYALIIAMAGIGLKITSSSIVKDGKSALLIGVLIFLIQIIFSTSMVFIFLN